jgi:hypothetical protein
VILVLGLLIVAIALLGGTAAEPVLNWVGIIFVIATIGYFLGLIGFFAWMEIYGVFKAATILALIAGVIWRLLRFFSD